MANPSTLSWRQPLTNMDGSPFDAEQFAGFTIYIDDAPGLSVPVQWSDDGMYSIPLATFADLTTYGEHTVQLATVHRNGNESPKSEPISFVMLDERVPSRPFDLVVS
ncbi:MAG: hypothetical protein C0P74_014725 [Gammaproteobacteria bacterium]